MKRKALSLALILTLLLALSGCGASKNSTDISAPSATSVPQYAGESVWETVDMEDSGLSAVTGSDISTGSANVSQDKIIYSADAGIETKLYDECIDKVYELIEQYGGFLESSSVGGTSYNSHGGRYATFVARIPSDNFSELTNNLSALGNVSYCSTSSDNVTTQYIDVQSRLDSYRIQEERLLSMLEKAEILEDMLTIEAHLSEVRYNIESYTTQMNYLDSQVSYSTITLDVEEVVEFTPDMSVTQSFFSRMKTAFSGGISGLVSAVQGLILFVLYFWYLLAVVAVVVVLLVRRARKRHRERYGIDEQNK